MSKKHTPETLKTSTKSNDGSYSSGMFVQRSRTDGTIILNAQDTKMNPKTATFLPKDRGESNRETTFVRIKNANGTVILKIVANSTKSKETKSRVRPKNNLFLQFLLGASSVADLEGDYYKSQITRLALESD